MNTSVDSQRKRTGTLLILMAFLTYLALTVSKNLYTAEKLTMISDGIGLLEDLAGSMRLYSITYTIGQVLLFFFVKKLNMRRFLFASVSLSAVLTALIGLTGELSQHYIIFLINGLLQAGMWGGTLKLLSIHLPPSMLPRAIAVMTSGPAVSGAGAYGIAALFGDNWRLPFLILGVLLAVFMLLYSIVLKRMEKLWNGEDEKNDDIERNRSNELPESFSSFFTRSGVVWFYVISIIVGVSLSSFYFIINNNTDVYLSEVGQMSHTWAKTLMMLAPLASAIGPILIVRSCEKHRNFFAVSLVYLLVSMIFFASLLFIYKSYPLATFVLLLLFMVFVNGARSVTLSIAGVKMRSKIDTGRYSMLVNAVSSLAMGIMPAMAADMIVGGETVLAGFGTVFGFVFLWGIFIVLFLSVTCLALRLKIKKK